MQKPGWAVRELVSTSTKPNKSKHQWIMGQWLSRINTLIQKHIREVVLSLYTLWTHSKKVDKKSQKEKLALPHTDLGLSTPHWEHTFLLFTLLRCNRGELLSAWHLNTYLLPVSFLGKKGEHSFSGIYVKTLIQSDEGLLIISSNPTHW